MKKQQIYLVIFKTLIITIGIFIFYIPILTFACLIIRLIYYKSDNQMVKFYDKIENLNDKIINKFPK